MGSAVKKLAPIAIIAVGAFAGYAIFGGALGAIRGASLGFSLAGQLSGGGSGSGGGSSAGSVGQTSIPDTGQLATAVGEDAWVPKQYGDRRAGMVLIASDVMNSNHKIIEEGAAGAFATSVYALGEGPWNKIIQLRLSDIKIFKDNQTINFGETYSFNNDIFSTLKDFSNLEVTFIQGNIGQSLPDVLSRVTNTDDTRWFRDTDIGNGICYMVLRIRREKEATIRQTAPTNFTIESEGKRIPEIRIEGSPVQYLGSDGTPSGDIYETGRNPALIALDQLRTSEFGLGLTNAEIDFDSFVNFANYCDNPGTYSDGTTIQPFRLDGQFGQGDTVRQILEEISLCTGALFADENGIVTVKIDKFEASTTSVAINADNVVDSLTRIEPKTSELPNVINVKYIDQRGFETIDVVEFDDTIQNAEGRKEADLQLRMVKEQNHALELAKRYLYQTRQPSFQFKMNNVGYDLDTYGVSSVADILNTNIVASGSKIRIFSITKERIIENEQQAPISVIAKLYTDDIYTINPAAMSIVPTVKISDAPGLLNIPTPTNATLTAVSSTQAILAWDNIPQYQTSISFRETTDANFTDYNVVEDSPAEINFPTPGTYVVRLRFIIPQANVGPGPVTQIGPFNSVSAAGDIIVSNGVERSSATGVNLPSQPIRTFDKFTQIRYAESEDGNTAFRQSPLSSQEIQNANHSDETTEPNQVVINGTQTSKTLDIVLPENFNSGTASNQTQVFNVTGTRSNLVATAQNETIDISLTDGFVFSDTFGNGKRLELNPTGPILPNQSQNSVRIGVTYDGANFWQITTLGHLRTASTVASLGTATDIILVDDDSTKFAGPIGAINSTSGLIRLTDDGLNKRLAFIVGTNPPHQNKDTWVILTVTPGGVRTYSSIVDSGANSTSRAKSTASNDTGSGATQIMTANRFSLDGGATWSTTSVGDSTRVNSIVYFDNKFIIATQLSGTVKLHSATNANDSFTERSSTSNNSGANFFIVNRGGTPRLNMLKRNGNNGDTADNNLTTTDGNTWTPIIVNSGSGVTGATGPGGLFAYFYNTKFYITFLQTGSLNYQTVISNDGINYSDLTDPGNLAGVVAYETFLNSTIQYWGSNNFASSNYNDMQLVREVDHNNPSISIDFDTENKADPATVDLNIPSLTASSTVDTLNEIRTNILANNPTFSVSVPLSKEVNVPFNSNLAGTLPEDDFIVPQNAVQGYAAFDGDNYWTIGGDFANNGTEVYRSPTFETPVWKSIAVFNQNLVDEEGAPTQNIFATNSHVLATANWNNNGSATSTDKDKTLYISSNPKATSPSFQGVALDNNFAHRVSNRFAGTTKQKSGDEKFLILGNSDDGDSGNAYGFPVPIYTQGDNPTRGWTTGFGSDDFTGNANSDINPNTNEVGMITLGTNTNDIITAITTNSITIETNNSNITFNSGFNRALRYAGGSLAKVANRAIPSNIAVTGTTTVFTFSTTVTNLGFYLGGNVYRFIVDPLYVQSSGNVVSFKGLTSNNNTALYDFHMENYQVSGTLNAGLLQTSDKVIDTGLTIKTINTGTVGAEGSLNTNFVVDGDQRNLFNEYDLMVNKQEGIYTQVIGEGVGEGGTDPYTIKSVASNGSTMIVNNPNIVNGNQLLRYNPFERSSFYQSPTKYASTSDGNLIPVATSDNPLATNGTTGNQLNPTEINMISVQNFPTTGGNLFYENIRFTYTGISGNTLTGVSGITTSSLDGSGKNITFFTEEITLTAYDGFDFNDAGFVADGEIYADRIIALGDVKSYDSVANETTFGRPSNSTLGFTNWKVGDKLYKRKLWGVSWDLVLYVENITSDSIFNRSGSNITAQEDNSFTFSIFEKDINGANIQAFYQSSGENVNGEVTFTKHLPIDTSISTASPNTITPRVIKKGSEYFIKNFKSTDLETWESNPTQLSNAGSSQLDDILYGEIFSDGSVIAVHQNDKRLFLASTTFSLQTISVDYNIADNFEQTFTRENSAINGDFVFNVSNGAVSNAILSTYTIKDPDGLEITTFTSSVSDAATSDLSNVLTFAETAVDSNTETPVNFTASFTGNTFTILADTSRIPETQWTIETNNGIGGDGNIEFGNAIVNTEVAGKRFSISPENGVNLLRINNDIIEQGYGDDPKNANEAATIIASAVKLTNSFVTDTITDNGTAGVTLQLNWQTDDEFNIDTNFIDAVGNQDTTITTSQNVGSIGDVFEIDGTTPITDTLENHKTIVILTEPKDVLGNSGSIVLNNRKYFNAYTDATKTTATSIRGNNNKIMDRTSNSLITDMRTSLSNANKSWTLSNNNTTDIATMRSVNKEHFPDVWTWNIDNSTGNGTWTNEAFIEGQAGFGIPTYYGLRSTDIDGEDIPTANSYAWFNLINTLGVGVDINPTYKQLVPFEPEFDFINDPAIIGFRVIPGTNQFESAITTSSEIQNLPINAPQGTVADGSTIVIVNQQFYIANIIANQNEIQALGTAIFTDTTDNVASNTSTSITITSPTETYSIGDEIATDSSGTNRATITNTSGTTTLVLTITPFTQANWAAATDIFKANTYSYIVGTTVYNASTSNISLPLTTGSNTNIPAKAVSRYSEPQGTPTWTQVS